MCGIAALFSMHSIEKQNIQKMTDIIIHRGPDAFGHEYFESDKWHLGHRRLSILDVSNAVKQPMSYLDNRYWITYKLINKEIFFASLADCAQTAKNSDIIMEFLAAMGWNQGYVA